MPKVKRSDDNSRVAAEPAWVRGGEDRPPSWSPPVPRFVDEPWRSERRMTPEEVAPLLAELKAKVATAGSAVNQVDPEAERRYLAACAKRKEMA